MTRRTGTGALSLRLSTHNIGTRNIGAITNRRGRSPVTARSGNQRINSAKSYQEVMSPRRGLSATGNWERSFAALRMTGPPDALQPANLDQNRLSQRLYGMPPTPPPNSLDRT